MFFQNIFVCFYRMITISPFTGGEVNLRLIETTIEYRGEYYTLPRTVYQCMDTGHQFSDSELEQKFIDDVHDEYNKRHAKLSDGTPKWLYRLEFKDDSCGLWYNGTGNWCFEDGIGSLSDECKTKALPMDYDWRYRQHGKMWFSSCSKKEDLMHWYSMDDAKTLLEKGFVFTRYLATDYIEYELETVFLKETSLKREEIDIISLFAEENKG